MSTRIAHRSVVRQRMRERLRHAHDLVSLSLEGGSLADGMAMLQAQLEGEVRFEIVGQPSSSVDLTVHEMDLVTCLFWLSHRAGCTLDLRDTTVVFTAKADAGPPDDAGESEKRFK
jgi:hypothetical protein